MAVVGRLFFSEDLSDKDLAKVKKVLKTFAAKQQQVRVRVQGARVRQSGFQWLGAESRASVVSG